METEKSAKAAAQEKTINTRAKAVFPRLTLAKVLELPKAIHELGEGDPVPRLVVFDRLGKSPDSGPSRTLISTSNSYGLTSGSYRAERLNITELGRTLLNAQSKDDHLRAAYKVLMANSLFADFHAKYLNRALPPEPLGIDTLKQMGGLSDTDAKTAFAVISENLREQGLTKEMSGRPSILPIDVLVSDTEPQAEDQTSAQEAAPIPPHISTKTNTKTTSKHIPQFNFNIQIQLPEDGSAETYDAIFKSMSEHLLNYNE